MNDELTFEAAYEALQTTVERLQAGDLTIAEAVSLYERGTALADLCARRLQEAELRVTHLTAEPEGSLAVGPLAPDD